MITLCSYARAEVHVELVPESRFAKVVAVAADTVVRAGSTLPVTTSLRVGRSSDREIELALSVPGHASRWCLPTRSGFRRNPERRSGRRVFQWAIAWTVWCFYER